MRTIGVKYKEGPKDAGLSEDEIARKVGDMCIEFEEAFDFIIKRKWESIDEEDKTEKEE
jgi:hypothetical protein